MSKHLLITVLFLLGTLAVWWLHLGVKTGLGQPQYLTGWILLGFMFAVALLSARKKLQAPPLGSARSWLQFHIYAGIFTIILFLIHVDFSRPTGVLEWVLALFYFGIAASGIIGLFMSRTFARRLADRGEEVIFEQIPFMHRGLRKRAEEIVLKSIDTSEATTLSDYYTRRLNAFFTGPKHYFSHLFESRRPLHKLTVELRELQRYMDDDEKEMCGELIELVETKDALDYHHALQKTLKGWLFVHIPLTYGLLVIVVLHVIIVYSFTGGFR